MGNEDLVGGTQLALVLPFFNQANKQRALALCPEPVEGLRSMTPK